MWVIPHFLLAMLTAMFGESTSVKRGAVAEADDEERALLMLKSEGKRGQKHNVKDTPEPQVKTSARLDPRMGQKREKHATPPVSGGRGRYYNVDSFCCGWFCSDGRRLELKCGCFCPSNVRIQPSRYGTVGSLCFRCVQWS